MLAKLFLAIVLFLSSVFGIPVQRDGNCITSPDTPGIHICIDDEAK